MPGAYLEMKEKERGEKRHNKLLDDSFPLETLSLDVTLPLVLISLSFSLALHTHFSLVTSPSSIRPSICLVSILSLAYCGINILKFNFHKTCPEITVK